MAALGAYEGALVFSTLICVAVVAVAVRRREEPGSVTLAILMGGAGLWSGAALASALVSDPQLDRLAQQLVFVGTVVVVLFFLLFALEFVGRSDLVTGRLIAVLSVEPAIVLFLVFSNPSLHLFWSPEGPVTMAFWIHTTYSYLLLTIATLVLLRAALRTERLYQGQFAALIVAVFGPWMANVLYLFGPLATDLTPVAFAISGVALAVAIREFGFMDVAPVARDVLVDTIDNAMVVVDADDRVIDTNETFETLFQVEGIAGKRLDAVLPSDSPLPDAIAAADDSGTVVDLDTSAGERCFEVTVSPVRDRRDRRLGRLVLLHDVTDRLERERALEEREQTYRTLAEHFPRGLTALFDDDLRYTLVDGGVFDYVDWQPGEFEGHRIDEVHDDGFGERFLEYYDAVFDGEEHTFTFSLEGSHYRTQVVPVTDADGEVLTGMAVTTDITELKERERELEQYETIVETVPDGVFVLDEDGILERTNAEGSRLVGYEPGELDGEPIRKLVDDGVMSAAGVQRYTAAIRDLLSSKTDRAETIFTHSITPKNGDERIVETHLCLRPFEDEFRGTIGVFRDVTEREETRRELERQNDRLEQVAGVISHDLRNPLNVASGRVSLVRETGDLSHLDAVEAAHDRMARLIDDVLSLARDGRTIREMEPVDLASVARDAWAHVDTADATLSVDADVTVEADAGRLSQVFENLYRNAVQHGGPEVSVTVRSTDDGFVVADDGPGIPESDRDAVFDAGYTDHDDGTGLGLAIARTIVEAHGWSVAIGESPEGGAEFRFTDLQAAVEPPAEEN